MKRSFFRIIPDLIRTFLTGWLLLAVLTLSISLLAPSEETSSLPESSVPDMTTEQPPTPSEDTASTPSLQPLQSTEANAELTPSLVYYNQKDSDWSTLPYGEDNIGGYGCGPTACAILISSLTDTTVTPQQMADWSVDNGCYIEGGGSYHNLIPLACKSYGLTVEGCDATKRDTVINALQSGAMVGVIMGPGDFTTTGHFIVLYGLTEDGDILVADPASKANSKAWDADTIFAQARSYAANGGPFWIVSR